METLAKVQEAVKKFDMTAEQGTRGINIYRESGEFAAEIIGGKIIQKYRGRKVLFGSVAVAAVKAIL